MSTGKILWLIWCAFWCIFWITAGWFVLPVLNVFMLFLSMLAAVPSFIGNNPQRTY